VLQWQQDWGTKVEYWEAKIASGQPAPEPFYERPEIEQGSEYLWRAFFDLGTERQIGMGLGPIPRSSAKGYAAELGISGDRFDRFWSILSAVDSEYLRLVNAVDKNRDVASDDAPQKSKPSAKPMSQKEKS
jgi:hypothetical protein